MLPFASDLRMTKRRSSLFTSLSLADAPKLVFSHRDFGFSRRSLSCFFSQGSSSYRALMIPPNILLPLPPSPDVTHYPACLSMRACFDHLNRQMCSNDYDLRFFGVSRRQFRFSIRIFAFSSVPAIKRNQPATVFDLALVYI